MPRKPEDVQVQLVMTDEMRRDLGKAALQHQDEIDRFRLMARGPMLVYIAKWFLGLPTADQLAVVKEGKRLMEGGRPRRGGVEAARVLAHQTFPESRFHKSGDDAKGEKPDASVKEAPTGVERRIERSR